MNVLFPNFSGYTNVAVCRSDNPKLTSCYVVDAGIKTISDNLISDGSFTYLPFYPGHLYIMYRGNGKEVDKVIGFQSEVDLRKHFVKLRQGSGKERQGKARKGKERQEWRKVKGLKA